MKEDFNRFCRAVPKDLTIDYIARTQPVVIVSGLTEERIPEVEAAFSAKVYKGQKFAPVSGS